MLVSPKVTTMVATVGDCWRCFAAPLSFGMGSQHGTTMLSINNADFLYVRVKGLREDNMEEAIHSFFLYIKSIHMYKLMFFVFGIAFFDVLGANNSKSIKYSIQIIKRTLFFFFVLVLQFIQVTPNQV